MMGKGYRVCYIVDSNPDDGCFAVFIDSRIYGNFNQLSYEGYLPVGQHTEVSFSYLTDLLYNPARLRLADPSEFEELHKELEGIYVEDDLEIYQSTSFLFEY